MRSTFISIHETRQKYMRTWSYPFIEVNTAYAMHTQRHLTGKAVLYQFGTARHAKERGHKGHRRNTEFSSTM